jgi:sensor histidine kinase YesM
VTISVHRQDGGVEIAVKDDGVGMRKEQAEQILAAPSRAQTSVGLRNIERRLKQLFHSGLHIQSEPGQGTVVRFFLPGKE